MNCNGVIEVGKYFRAVSAAEIPTLREGTRETAPYPYHPHPCAIRNQHIQSGHRQQAVVGEGECLQAVRRKGRKPAKEAREYSQAQLRRNGSLLQQGEQETRDEAAQEVYRQCAVGKG